MTIVAECDLETNTLTHHDARSAFRATVAEVAARAKEKLPEAVNGRVESAVKLVLAHDVTPLEDGTIEVGSSSDPLKTYRLVGTACECQDFTRGQAPEGWCQHRIAAGIAKRVQELRPQAPPVETTEPAPTTSSAPTDATAADAAAPRERSGMRLEVQVMIEGRQVKVALWGPDDADVQARLQAVLAQYPVQTPASPLGPPQAADTTPQCKYHGPMKASTKAPGTFFCTKKNFDGSYCRERYPQA